MKDMAACRAIAVHHDQATEHADQGRSYELSWAAAAAAGGGTVMVITRSSHSYNLILLRTKEKMFSIIILLSLSCPTEKLSKSERCVAVWPCASSR